ncbi:MarR family transcriptional regulator [Alicyclobacillus sacchari]|uniref:MarR family transcriptional regulator n=1 Tax=Alicyclobacillus sacchari TaxID=392010 RepID=A0A4R8LMM6_9BACL|nr:MarR family transcriptional regulator [Alicyclobacillus sacchari]TDY44579.1 MarR family transcriptional regulator [Alicyclobacillus sacchari]GMA57931.1 MarR family transcriptional regulator [Alicyclobacillus sacchari]
MDVLQELEREVAVFARRVEGARQSWQRHQDLDRSAYLILLALANDGPLAVGQLANTFQLDISTISRQLAPIVDAGLVAKERGEIDKRQVRLSITPEGSAALEATRESRRQLYAELLADWSEADREHFLGLLKRFNERLLERQQLDR